MANEQVPAAVQPFLAGAEQVLARCARLAAVSAVPDRIERSYLTAQHRAANDLVAGWMAEAGLKVHEDAAGSIVGETDHGAAQTLVIGSHLDTVPNAGAYDGILGVLLGIEAASACAAGLPFDLEVIGFGEEEGVRFGTTLMTSLARAGQWDDAWWALRDGQGVTLEQAARTFGLEPAQIASACPDRDLLGYLEVHIEQGPVLEQMQLPLGVVTGIAAARRFRIELTGQAGHAGTVPLHLRRDALVGAADLITTVRHIAARLDIVATVGQLQVQPGAVNVIPGKVTFTLDVRAVEQTLLDEFDAQFADRLRAAAAEQGLSFDVHKTHDASAAISAQHLQDVLSRAVHACGLPVHHLGSGAGHDAMAMARLCDTGMLFVRCLGGISHNPQESVTLHDVACALAALTRTIELMADEYDR